MHDSRCKIMSKCNHVHKLSAAHVQLMQLSYCQSVMATARKSPAVLEHFIVPNIHVVFVIPDGHFKVQCKYLEPPAKKSKHCLATCLSKTLFHVNTKHYSM